MVEHESLEVRECKKPGCVMSPQGVVMSVPSGWKLLPPGDATVTRRVKAAGPHWIVKRRKGNKWFSLGIWADSATIDRFLAEVAAEKSRPEYGKKLEAGRVRREKEQQVYEQEFREALAQFLRFHPCYEALQEKLVQRITAHAIPVGSGTVARTSRIPLEDRVEAATIAWMRHQTTAYDHMVIPRVKGMRRDVRRQLAKRSVALLKCYRSGETVDPSSCPLSKALK